MHYIIFPYKDATIYSEYSDKNTGFDQMLEINKINDGGVSGSNYISRALIRFDITKIKTYISSSNLTGSLTPNFYLNLFTATANQTTLNNSIVTYPLSSSWEVGMGEVDNYVTDGVSWKYRDSVATWSLADGSPSPGGSYISTVSGSHEYGYMDQDLKLDVTNIVSIWISGSSNHGFILKRTDAQESDAYSYGLISFYSMDTHTIYSPYLEMVWNDQSYVVPISGKQVSANKVTISMFNLKGTYKQNSITQFDMYIKELHKRKTFFETLNPSAVNYISGSTSFYYQIQDAYNGRIMVPFSDYSRVSLGTTGHYFVLNLSGFMPERYYKIIYKMYIGNTEFYYDNNYTFKVVK